MMVKIALFVVTMLKVARFRYTICGKWAHKDCTRADTLNSNWFWGNQARRGLNTPDPGVMRPSVGLSYFHYKSQNFKNCPYLWIQVDKKYVKV
jgi:hypothetical protein